MRKLDRLADKHVIIHTGQHYSHSLSDIFFEELELRQPDYRLAPPGTTVGAQLSGMFRDIESILEREKPDAVLLLGGSNSALCALLVERMGIPVVHMEAGSRCRDLKVPEEKNRIVIDAVSTINMPYTSYGRENLLREGFPSERIVLTGNPINEVIMHYGSRIAESDILERLALVPGEFLVVTVHRAENVDNPARLDGILSGFNLVAEQFGKRLICSVHPRTRSKLLHGGIKSPMHDLVEFHEPFGFFDFVRLEQSAWCAITDSGSVQEECCLFGIPTVTIRTTTDRPETVDCGSNAVCGLIPEQIAIAVKAMTSMPAAWQLPDGYGAADVSNKVVNYMLGGKWDIQ